MNSQIIQEIFNIKSSSVDDMKNLLKQIKSHKDEKLSRKIGILEKELKEIQKAKKYGLVWEEKEEHFDKETVGKLPVLEEVKKYSIHQDGLENNILIEGDNYHTLSVLNYTHKGKIDIIYIDPFYNTGNKDFIYNDKYVDKDDKFRHSKRLSFINKRLRLAKNLLSEKGTIFISIDDNEQAQLKILCDEIFGEENFISNLIWNQKVTGGHDSSHINNVHEYILLFAKNKNLLKLNKDVSNTEYNLFDEKENKFFKWDSLWTVSHGYTKNCDYPITGEKGVEIFPWMCHKNKEKVKGIARWYWSKETYEKNKENLLVKQDKNGDFKVYKKVFSTGEKPFQSILQKENVAGTSAGKQILEDVFGVVNVFDNPKSLELLKYLLKISSKKESLILDFFAGSGTTGHAVLELNKADGGNRKFILATNNENNICEKVTYERIKRVMTGYKNQKGEQVEGLGGNLTYLKNTFIDKHNSNDDLRLRMVARCSELLCLKENIWEEVKQKNDKIKLFKRDDKYLAILYDMFYFDEFKEVLNNLDKAVSIYAFSHYKLNKTDFEGLKIKFEIEQIPDPILEVYESIFGV